MSCLIYIQRCVNNISGGIQKEKRICTKAHTHFSEAMEMTCRRKSSHSFTGILLLRIILIEIRKTVIFQGGVPSESEYRSFFITLQNFVMIVKDKKMSDLHTPHVIFSHISDVTQHIWSKRVNIYVYIPSALFRYRTEKSLFIRKGYFATTTSYFVCSCFSHRNSCQFIKIIVLFLKF